VQAAVGDRVVIASNSLDRPVRTGRVIELRHEDGSPPYLVEWSDTGQTALVFPGPDARIEHHSTAPTPKPADERRHVRTWVVEIQLYETDSETSAHAVLSTGEAVPITSDGHSRRRPGEVNLPEIGDEIAVGRALHHLGELLLTTASGDLAAVHGHPTALAD
jgi:Domain of unknown function (DUF1918)/Domain of unknown function (DUF1876)